MSFFDLIENDQIQPPDPVTTTWNSGENTPKPGSNKPHRQRKTGRRSNPAPEKLKFLVPCPICQGTKFTHGSNGGFFCDHCQPGIEGRPVKATGNRQPPETVEGLPCAGCGATSYQRIENGYIFDDGTLADGWHCGSDNCHIKLLTGNKQADQKTKDQALASRDDQDQAAAKPTRERQHQKK